MDYTNRTTEATPPPPEPRVHGNGWAIVSLIIGIYFFLSGLAILFFPRYEWNLDNWWKPLVLGAILLLISVLLFQRRSREKEQCAETTQGATCLAPQDLAVNFQDLEVLNLMLMKQLYCLKNE